MMPASARSCKTGVLGKAIPGWIASTCLCVRTRKRHRSGGLGGGVAAEHCHIGGPLSGHWHRRLSRRQRFQAHGLGGAHDPPNIPRLATSTVWIAFMSRSPGANWLASQGMTPPPSPFKQSVKFSAAKRIFCSSGNVGSVLIRVLVAATAPGAQASTSARIRASAA